MGRETVHAPGAPEAAGPYSHAVRASGELLFCSGQIAPGAGPVGAQTTACLRQLEAVCAAAGTTLARAVRCTVYCIDLAGDWAEVNEAYGAFFPAAPPARAAIGVAALPRGAAVEVDAVVAL